MPAASCRPHACLALEPPTTSIDPDPPPPPPLTPQAAYVPLKITEGVYILPEGTEPEDPGAMNITLQPGVAFGTGGRQHWQRRLAWPVQADGPRRGGSAMQASRCLGAAGHGACVQTALQAGHTRA